MRFFPLFFRLVHRNCLIFGTKVNLDNTYTLAILKLFGKFLIPLNPLKNQKFKVSRDKSRDPASRACSYLSLVISHFNLAYLHLCKFALFDEPLHRGLVCYILKLARFFPKMEKIDNIVHIMFILHYI